MLQHGLTDVVVCPGSRNAAIVNDIAEAGLRCHPVTDERSAGFFAIGLAHATSRPVAVCVTSGSAVLGLAPAVAEAFYQRVPILVVTADRPERWIGQMDGQTLPQPGAFGALVSKCVSLPEPSWDDADALNVETAWHSNRLVNEALLALAETQRPVQVNVPLSEPLFDFSRASLPVERVISLSRGLDDAALAELADARRVMIVVGQLAPHDAEAVRGVIDGLQVRFAVLAESLANLRTSCIGNFEDVLSDPSEDLRPDLVITLGGHIVSKPLKKFLRSVRPRHWHVSDDSDVPDLFMSLSRVVRSGVRSFLDQLAASVSSAAYAASWRKCSEGVKARAVSSPDLLALGLVVSAMSDLWHVHVANSSMVRNLQKLWTPDSSFSAHVLCNRGVNGIEGSVSEAVGYWASGVGPTCLLVGDLSFFYDQNALWNNAVKQVRPDAPPLRIFVMNNGCGEIFHHLPGLSRSSFAESYVAASHVTTAEGIALQNGCAYRAVRSLDDLSPALADFFAMGQGGVAILEYFVPQA